MGRVIRPTKAEKYDRQKELTAARVRKHRQKMSEEDLEKKRKYDRDRYKRLKEEGVNNGIEGLTPRDQRKKRKNWRIYSKNYRLKKINEKKMLEETPPQSEGELEIENRPSVSSSTKKKLGRQKVRRDRAKAYKKIDEQEKKIKNLERRLKKYQKRLEREKIKRLSLVGSPSPNSKVNKLVGKEKVSPCIKKRLFVGYALEKQLKAQVNSFPPKSKGRQCTYKAIGSNLLRKYRIQRHLTSIVNYKANRVLDESKGYEYQRNKYCSKQINEATVLRSFFEDDTVSRMCPGKKDVKRCGKMKKQKRVLQDSMKNLYKRYVKETSSKMSYTTFTRARPFWVVRPQAKDRETCACVVHSNMELLVAGLKTVNAIEERTPQEILKKTVCSADSLFCMTNQCKECKDKIIEFKPLDDINIKIHQWRTVRETRIINGKEKLIKKVVKQKEVTDLTSLKDRFKNMLIKFKKHVFDAIYQLNHKKKIRQNLKDKELMIMIDFSENYNAKYHKEVQSIHFGASKKQISLHTGVRYHNEKGKTVSKGFCTVSDCLDHKAHGVWAHLEPILLETAKLFPLTECVHFFSDSPSSQYRNRSNLFLFKTLLPGYFPTLKKATWNFSESGHGKGAMDGIGGTLKRMADQHVYHCNDITCAKEFVDIFEESKVRVILVPTENFENMKNKLKVNIPAVTNIMKMKQITLCKDHLFGRTLSCRECPEDKCCAHYSIGSRIFVEKAKKKIQVEDVYSSSDEEQDHNKQENDVTQGTSSTPTGLQTSEVDIKPGEFVLVRFESKKSMHQYIGICRSCGEDVDDGEEVMEPEVVFLKSVSSDRRIYSLDEKDVSFISPTQIVATLPPPTLIHTGSRTFYKFKRPIDTY